MATDKTECPDCQGCGEIIDDTIEMSFFCPTCDGAGQIDAREASKIEADRQALIDESVDAANNLFSGRG